MDDIKAKVQKLLALAGNNSNEAEANVAMEKAMRLLAEHNLSMVDVAEEEREQVDQLAVPIKYLNPWRRSIIGSATRLYFCEAIYYEHGKYDKKGKWVTETTPVIIGRDHNVAVCRSMIEYLIKTSVRLGSEYAKETGGGGKAQRGFERGCGERLATRLWRLYVDQTKPKAAEGGSNLPALYENEKALVDQFIEKAFTGLTTANTRKTDLKGSDVRAGWAAGADVSLNDQIDDGKAPKGSTLLK